MQNRLHNFVVVNQGMILPLFSGCNTNEPIFDNPDIGFEDAEFFYEFACRKESLIFHALNYASEGFAPLEGAFTKSTFELFFAELEELNRKAEKILEAIIRLQNSGVLQRPTHTRGILIAVARFFDWINRVGERNRKRIITITSNISANDCSKLYNSLTDSYKNCSNGEADFWQKLQEGELDAFASQIFKHFYNNIDTEFSVQAQAKGLTPQQIVAIEGEKLIETGGSVVIYKDSMVIESGTLSVKNNASSSSIVLAEKKSESNTNYPSIYITTKEALSDSLDMLIHAGEWLVTVINENGNRATEEVEVKLGETTITEVITEDQETDEENDPENFEFRIKVEKFKIATYFEDQRVWMEYSIESDGFEPLKYEDGHYIATVISDLVGSEDFKFKIDFINKKLLMEIQTTKGCIFTFKNIPTTRWDTGKMIFMSSGEDLYDRFSYQIYNNVKSNSIVGMGFENRSRAMIEIRRRSI